MTVNNLLPPPERHMSRHDLGLLPSWNKDLPEPNTPSGPKYSTANWPDAGKDSPGGARNPTWHFNDGGRTG
jgi:hypothetical protein